MKPTEEQQIKSNEMLVFENRKKAEGLYGGSYFWVSGRGHDVWSEYLRILDGA